uniref:EEF13 protein n=1 Tax=Solanum melongena TaxID=223891 RepID=Q9SLQ4_SOLME|nr:EEF13 [Solanum melongena]
MATIAEKKKRNVKGLMLYKIDSGSAVQFKSSKRTDLVKAGYRIVGNIGDQWTDLIGENVGARTFKVPDPMYYIG